MSPTPDIHFRDQLLLIRAIATLVRANQPLDRGLQQLSGEWHGPLADAATKVAEDLARGNSLTATLARGSHPHARSLAATIAIGQATGNLAVALESWVSMLAAQSRAWRSLLMAMVYPILLMIVTVASLFFTLQQLAPKYQQAFRAIAGSEPPWMQVPIWFHAHPLLTLVSLTGLLMVVPAGWLLAKRIHRRNAPPGELSMRWYLHAHMARLARLYGSSSTPVAQALPTLLLAAGKPTAEQDHIAVGQGLVDTQAWIGRETTMALIALRDGLMPSHQVQQLLTSIAEQTERMADVRAQRNAQWFPMIVAIMTGSAVVIAYVGLIYGPWIELFRILAR